MFYPFTTLMSNSSAAYADKAQTTPQFVSVLTSHSWSLHIANEGTVVASCAVDLLCIGGDIGQCKWMSATVGSHCALRYFAGDG